MIKVDKTADVRLVTDAGAHPGAARIVQPVLLGDAMRAHDPVGAALADADASALDVLADLAALDAEDLAAAALADAVATIAGAAAALAALDVLAADHG